MYERILKHLKKYGYITTLQAFNQYGCTRLSHYIYLLRKNGYTVMNVPKTSVNRYGETTHYYEYHLVEVEDNG